MCAPCLRHMWNKNPTLSQNHNLPTYLPTHLPIEFPTYLCAYFPTSQALVPIFSFPAFSLPTLPTFSLFLSKTTPYLSKTITYPPIYRPNYLSNFLPTYVLLFLPPRLFYLLSHYPPYIPSHYFSQKPPLTYLPTYVPACLPLWFFFLPP